MSELKVDLPESAGICPNRLARVSNWLQRWVDSGRLPCLVVAIARRDRLVYLEMGGHRDVEAKTRVERDTLFRIYSMTKPITTCAAMMLYEEGAFQLDDPIAEYIPAFACTEVYAGGDRDNLRTEPLQRPITVHDLMTHTSGMTYAFQRETPVDAYYRRHKVEFNANLAPLDVLCERTAAAPLLFQPGARWNYGVSTDVLGRLVEIWSGLSLREFFLRRIFQPLGMADTAFEVPQDKLQRLAACYEPAEGGGLARTDGVADSRFAEPAVTLSGGGGLVSTVDDYMRFTHALLRGGRFQGERILGRMSVELMMRNHLPGDLADMGQPRFSEMPFHGIGFGLGGSVLLNPAKARILGSEGEFAWGGMASTAFWVDPAEDLTVVLLTQLIPSSTYPIRRQLRTLVYQALVD